MTPPKDGWPRSASGIAVAACGDGARIPCLDALLAEGACGAP